MTREGERNKNVEGAVKSKYLEATEASSHFLFARQICSFNDDFQIITLRIDPKTRKVSLQL